MNPDTTPTPFFPKHEAALASKSHAARRPSGVKAMANGLWESEWGEPKAISDNFFLAHESLIIAADQMDKLERELAEKTNEAQNWHQHYRDEQMEKQKLKQAFIEKEKEVARLRKYVDRIEVYSPENEWSEPEWRKLIGSKEENEDPDTLFSLYQFRLAPAPEEPVTGLCLICREAQTTCPSELCEECKVEEEPVIQKNRITEPDWRELGPDETIQEGDEYSLGLPWDKVQVTIGATPRAMGHHKYGYRFRTRRPLPTTNQQEISSKLAHEPKQEEMPLTMIERSLKLIEGDGKYPLDHDEMFGEVVLCIRYLQGEVLRIGNISSEDSGHNFSEIQKIWKEIQKLKEEK